MRADGRKPDQLRPVEIIPNYQQFADGAALVRWGNTWVLCTASIEERVPPFRVESGGGWLTAEYNMLPASVPQGRKSRRSGGRESEIQRLIGRSLRAAVDIDRLGQRTVTVDCDVLQADGGTRVASITGGYVAAALAIGKLRKAGKLDNDPVVRQVAAVSVGILGDDLLLDLPYEEDSRVDVDMNLVMTASGDVIEAQGTAEGEPFTLAQLSAMAELGKKGVLQLCEVQAKALAASST